MNYLDEGVLFEVLKRVPARSLLRFKCVNRLWHSLISDPKFVKAQLTVSLHRNPNPSERLLLHEHPHPSSVNVEQVIYSRLEDDAVFTKLDCQLINPDEDIFIEGSCHGLVCLRAANDMRRFFLYNPTTRELRKLPKFPRVSEHFIEFFCGFGYDTLKDDYKLVIGTGHYQSMPTVYIFSLKSNSWRSIGECNYNALQTDGKYSGGFLHWLNRESQPDTIVSFDISAEEFHEAMLPMPGFMVRGGFTQLNVTGGGWLVAYRNLMQVVEVWIMKGCCLNSTWTKLCCFFIDQFNEDDFLRVPLRLSPLMKDGKVVLCVKWRDHYIGMYDPDESFEIFQLPSTRYRSNRMMTYVESLVLVNVNN